MELVCHQPSTSETHGASGGLLPAPTLLELVAALCDETDDDREVVCAVLDLLQGGRVRLAAIPASPMQALDAR